MEKSLSNSIFISLIHLIIKFDVLYVRCRPCRWVRTYCATFRLLKALVFVLKFDEYVSQLECT